MNDTKTNKQTNKNKENKKKINKNNFDEPPTHFLFPEFSTASHGLHPVFVKREGL